MRKILFILLIIVIAVQASCLNVENNNSKSLSCLWNTSLYGKKCSEFASDESSLYIVMCDINDIHNNKLYRLNSESGHKEWNISLDSISYKSNYLYDLVVYQEFIYVPCNNKLQAIEKRTGKKIFSIEGNINSCLSNQVNGFSYIVIDNYLCKIDLKSCKIILKTKITNLPGLSIVHQLYNQVHLFDQKGNLLSFSLPDCKLIYSNKVFDDLSEADTPYFAYSGNTLVIADKSENRDFLRAFSAIDGSKIWEKELKRVFQPIITKDDNILVNSYCLNLQTGAIIWFNPTISDFVNHISIYDNNIYYFTKYRDYVVVNPSTGNVIYKCTDFSNGTHLFYSPVVYNNIILCLSSFSILNAYVPQINSIAIVVNDRYMKVGKNTIWTDYPPIIKNGQIYVDPITIIDSLGGSTVKDINNGSCRFVGKNLVYFVGQYGLYKNEVIGDTRYFLDAIKIDKNGANGIYLPLQLLLQYFNLKETYQGDKKTIIISK